MTSQVGVANLACTKIGAARIISLDDTPKQAKAIRAIWDATRDAELSAHPWVFATTRVQLPASATAPAYGWARAFPLPSDYLCVVEVGERYVMYQSDTTALFEIENQADVICILCDQGSPLRVRYVRRVENTGLYHALFVEALACRLAAEIAEDITQSGTKRDLAWQEYKQAIQIAQRTNAIQLPPAVLPDPSWWIARNG